MPKTPNFRRNRTIPELISDIRKPKKEADTAWYKVGASEAYQISFQGAWANVGGSGNPDAQWYVDETGETKVIGLVTTDDNEAAEGTVIFEFPEETRPRYKEVFVCAVEGGGTANISVYPNGEVVLENFNG